MQTKTATTTDSGVQHGYADDVLDAALLVVTLTDEMRASIAGKDVIFHEIAPELLSVDPTYQRRRRDDRVDYMVQNFNRHAFNVIEVNMRPDGSLYIFDGQHRVAAWQRLYPGRPVPCLVHDGMTVEEEAGSFWFINGNRNKPTPVGNFRALLRANEPITATIYGIVRKYGLDMGWDNVGAEDGLIVAASALYSIYHTDPENLEATIRVIKEIWGGAGPSITSQSLYGMDRFLRRYKGEITSEADLVRRLKRVDVKELRMRAQRMYIMTSDQRLAWALALAAAYNRGLRSNRLTEWTHEGGLYLGPGRDGTGRKRKERDTGN
jgi:hypothetical protein